MSQQNISEFTQTVGKGQVPVSDRFLTVEGHRFHHIWLRDHCLCSQCHHATAFQKIYDISDRIEPPKPKSAALQDSKLIVEWEENPPHRSIFPLPWLLSYAYDREKEGKSVPSNIKSQLNREKILWDSASLNANPPKWPQFGVDTIESLIDQIDRLGFTILKNLAWEDLEAFTSSIGPIYKVGRNTPFTSVKAVPKAQDLSYGSGALSLHTDLTYIPAPRVVELLYCVEHQASGGESVLVDGYRVAQDFRTEHPDYFQILSETPVQFREFSTGWGYFVSHTTPILKLDVTGEVSDVYFCHKNFGLDLPFDRVESFYEAYCTFASYLKNPAYQYWFRMEPGDCQLVQNFRVLHGRSAFDPTSGPRHLEGGYMEWTYYAGARDFHRIKPLYEAGVAGAQLNG